MHTGEKEKDEGREIGSDTSKKKEGAVSNVNLVALPSRREMKEGR